MVKHEVKNLVTMINAEVLWQVASNVQYYNMRL
jgi:hypothetical protein